MRNHYVWSPEEISALITAAQNLSERPEARYNYAPILQVLALTGLRVSEALALRWGAVDLLAGELHVRASLGRDGTINEPKTEAGTRTVPLSPGLVDLLVSLKPDNASEHEFVFASKSGGPLSYWNVRSRGLVKALEAAGLAGRGITVHDLRSAAASILVAQGLSPVEVASVLGHRDANITLRVYAKLFAPRDVAARVRKAQSAIL